MSEALLGVREARIGRWDLGYHSVGWDREVRVHQGVYRIYPRL